MTATAFDTLAAARDMERAGMDRAEAVAAAIHAGQGDLATKADLTAGLATLRAEMAALGARLYHAMLFQAIAIASVVIAAVKLL